MTEHHVCFCGPCSTRVTALKAELLLKEAELQLPGHQRILEIRRLEADLKNTSRDYGELRESYDKLFDEHQRLKESLSQAVHGYHHVNCVKVVHVGSGHLHGPDDDSPYDVDGCRYCGRCHIAL